MPPGEAKRRRKALVGAAASAPNGGSARCISASADFRMTGTSARSAGERRAERSTSPSWRASARLFPCSAPSRSRKAWKRASSIMGPLASRQPAFAALVRLHVLERAPLVARHAEIEFAHVLVGAQRLGRAVEHDPAGFENIAETRVAQRNVGVLLGEQERDALALIEALHDLEDLLDHLRGEAHRRLVGAGRASASTSSPGRSGTSAARRRRYSPPATSGAP